MLCAFTEFVFPSPMFLSPIGKYTPSPFPNASGCLEKAQWLYTENSWEGVWKESSAVWSSSCICSGLQSSSSIYVEWFTTISNSSCRRCEAFFCLLGSLFTYAMQLQAHTNKNKEFFFNGNEVVISVTLIMFLIPSTEQRIEVKWYFYELKD